AWGRPPQGAPDRRQNHPNRGRRMAPGGLQGSLTKMTTTVNALSAFDYVTEGGARELRCAELAYEAAAQFPGLLPTRTEIDEERTHRLKDIRGLGIRHQLDRPLSRQDLVHRIHARARVGLRQQDVSGPLTGGPIDG